MSEKKEIKLDSILINDSRFISDPTIKKLIKGETQSEPNPNPSKYLPANLVFEAQAINYAAALETISPFAYDPSTDAKFESNGYFGPFFVAKESSVYIGQMRGGIREGRGMLVYLDGNIYEGYFEEDSTSLKGRLLFDNGDIYVGDIENMGMNGQGVYFNNTEKSKYTGSFADDAPHGQGEEEWADGTRYKGQFIMGVKEGRGVFKTRDGGVYEGDLVNGIFEGKGTLVSANKIKYTGTWRNAELQSPAEIVYEDGKKYEGEVNKELKPHGKGTIQTDSKQFTGNFKNGNLDGMIVTKYSSGETKTCIYENGVFSRWIDGTPKMASKAKENFGEVSGSTKKTIAKKPSEPLNFGQMANPVNPTQSLSSQIQSPKKQQSKSPPKKKGGFCC